MPVVKYTNFVTTHAMGHEAIKLELIEWLTRLEDEETIEYLKIIKEFKTTGKDWWDELPAYVRKEINKSMENKQHDQLTVHDEVVKKYGLGS